MRFFLAFFFISFSLAAFAGKCKPDQAILGKLPNASVDVKGVQGSVWKRRTDLLHGLNH